MELPPIFEHQLKALLADDQWRRLRWKVAWVSACFLGIPLVFSFWVTPKPLFQLLLPYLYWFPALTLGANMIPVRWR